tara:strand:- start:183 stop:986 length:804 start_codon:yes stop_codon:yes gene_type:complete
MPVSFSGEPDFTFKTQQVSISADVNNLNATSKFIVPNGDVTLTEMLNGDESVYRNFAAGTVTSGITNTNVMVNTEAAGYRAYTIGGFTDSSIGTYFPATGGGLEIFTGPLTASLTIGTITGGGGSGQNRGVYLTGNYDDSSVSQFADIGVVNLFFSVGELANYLRNRTLTVEKFTETTRHTGPSTLSASVVMYNAYTDSFGPTMSATIPASQGFYTSKDYTIGAGSFGLGEDANQWQMRITYTKDDSTAGGSVDYEWFGYSLSFSLS